MLFQFPTAPVASDMIYERGFFSPWPRTLWDCARRRNQTIWPALLEMLQGSLLDRRRRISAIVPDALGESARIVQSDRCDHPWIDQARGLPAGKRLQVASLADGQLVHGPSWSADTGRLVHPLLSQPFVQACLQIASWQLAYGVQSRALARDVFSRWLVPSPSPIKGSAAGYYCRSVLAGLPVLRPLLLEGNLVREGVLDRAGLARMLEPERLIAGQDYRSVAVWASIKPEQGLGIAAKTRPITEMVALAESTKVSDGTGGRRQGGAPALRDAAEDKSLTAVSHGRPVVRVPAVDRTLERHVADKLFESVAPLPMRHSARDRTMISTGGAGRSIATFSPTSPGTVARWQTAGRLRRSWVDRPALHLHLHAAGKS